MHYHAHFSCRRCWRQNYTSNIILYKSNQILGYDDDIGLIGSTTTDVFEDLENEKYMLLSRYDAIYNNFIYLGSEVKLNNNTSVEVKRRIALANICLYSLNGLL
uniref:Uncharacterized protein n=1 Tax=Megaselia scalaris TaxID=36166 RepID=T1GEH6_MEGSC